MTRSLKVGSVAGIGIFLHWTFVLLLAGVPALYLWQGASVRGTLAGTGVVFLVFGCVVLHELGHALTARRFDVGTLGITLYPIGGLARLERIPEEPTKELWIALAGPAVNVALAGMLGALAVAAGVPLVPEASLFDPAGATAGNALATLVWINAALALFNMLPAFPMDGGRVLRALLATRLPYARATQIAANVGQVMALGFGGLGLFTGNLVLVFISVFVWLGARQEAQQASFRQTTQGLRVHHAMMTRFQALSPDDTLESAGDELLDGTDHDFPVVEETADGARVVGLLTRKQLVRALSEHGPGARVGAVVSGAPFTAQADEALSSIFVRMKSSSEETVPVIDEGRLVGLLTLENVAELMMISSALGETLPAARTRNGQGGQAQKA